jgi:beta-N-acetylhexosaminidase
VGRGWSWKVLALPALLALTAGACTTSNTSRAATSPPSRSKATTHALPTASSSPPATAPTTTTAPCLSLASWSNASLAAETVIVPVEETDLSAADPEVAAGAGGVILFGSQAPADLGAQTTALRSLVPSRLGLLVMTDEEGGGVQRLPNLVGSLPWATQMGASWTPAQITEQVAAVARNMAQNGVNMDLAPVVDVDGQAVPPGPTDPDGFRSFSGSTSVVTADGLAYMQGLEQGGVIPVLKHFPGLGGASGNTDDGPADTLPWSTLEQSALPPFEAGIAAGAPAIMVSNAIVPGLSTIPASLSPVVIEQELVGTLHFGGLIMTDSLSAGAISGAGYTPSTASVQALEAGADMVMYGPTDPSVDQAQFQTIVTAITSAVTSGSLTRARLQSAATAVLRTLKVNVCQ